MFKKLTIQQFGPIKHVEIELRQVNLFIGEQSIGKSTLAKLITIFTDRLSLCMLCMKDMWNTLLQAHGLDVYSNDQYQITFEMSRNGNNEFHFSINPQGVDIDMMKDGKRITDQQVILNELISQKHLFHPEAVNDVLEMLPLNQKRGMSTETVQLLMDSIYIPAERVMYSVATKLLPAMMLAKSAVSQPLLRFIVNLEAARNKYPNYDMPLLGVSYKYENNDDYFVLNENKKQYPLMVASSGIQSAFPLMLVLHYAVHDREYSSFVVEEPECNLFPSKQVELLQFILKTVCDDNRTLTITTHSPYLLTALNNHLYAGQLKTDFKQQEVQDAINNRSHIFPLDPDDCAVYSLGKDVNQDGAYCEWIMRHDGLIEYNALDETYATLGDDFSQLEDIEIKMMKGD